MIAEDCETGELVAVKFMKHLDNYTQEKESRKGGSIDDSRYVIPLLESFNEEEDSAFYEEIIRKGFGDYKYCIIMSAADRNLQQIVNQEKIAGKDWDAIKKMYGDIVKCVDYLHSKRVIHGDLKPLNIMRNHDGKIVLIDFDAAVFLDAVDESSSNHGNLGSKVSTGFLPPEMLYFLNLSPQISQSSRPTVAVKSPVEYEKHVLSGLQPPFETVKASPRTDMWCLGAILYYLCTGETLFLNNDSDNTDNNGLLQILEWTDVTKNDKLSKISDELARNLVSRLLSKDPTKRPLTTTGLHIHVFIIS
jgi:serine/threonine protein kinase